MSKRYREALEGVSVAEGGLLTDAPTPAGFVWRGRDYQVVQVLGHWREDAGWWRRPDGEPIRIQQTDLWRVEATRREGSNGHTRLLAEGRGVYELVQRDDHWHLDRVWD